MPPPPTPFARPVLRLRRRRTTPSEPATPPETRTARPRRRFCPQRPARARSSTPSCRPRFSVCLPRRSPAIASASAHRPAPRHRRRRTWPRAALPRPRVARSRGALPPPCPRSRAVGPRPVAPVDRSRPRVSSLPPQTRPPRPDLSCSSLHRPPPWHLGRWPWRGPCQSRRSSWPASRRFLLPATSGRGRVDALPPVSLGRAASPPPAMARTLLLWGRLCVPPPCQRHGSGPSTCLAAANARRCPRPLALPGTLRVAAPKPWLVRLAALRAGGASPPFPRPVQATAPAAQAPSRSAIPVAPPHPGAAPDPALAAGSAVGRADAGSQHR